MTTPMHERWSELSRHLDQALDLPEAQRGPWLTALRDRDPDMAALLDQALRIRGSAGFDQFLEGPSPLAGTVSDAALVGRHIGAYVIDAEIGSGGMGSVWRAHRADGRYEAEVAIKFVHAAWMGQAGEQRFQFEGRALGRLNHPNIARLLDAGVAEVKQPYLVLEYVEGVPIDVYCEHNHLDVGARIKLFVNVLQAVAHAHANLIVHRDIKPSNVYVKSDGTVKLLDFGIAKLIDSDVESAAQLTRASAVALTPQYAAPEQLLGQPISTVTDVYALGLLLYVLLTGEHPVPKGTRSSAALVQAVLTDEPARASTVGKIEVVPSKSLQGDLDNILHKAIKKNPAERYASVDAFAEDLQRYLTDQPVQARPDTAAYRLSKFVKRHRVGTALGSLALLALTASVVIATIQAARAERAAAHAIEEKTRADKEAAAAIEQRDIALEGIAQAQDATHLATFMLVDALPEDRQEFTRKILLKAADEVRGSKELPQNRRAVLLNILGDQLESRRDYEAAFPLYSEAATLALEVNDVDIAAAALCRAGSTDALLNRAADGMPKIEKGLDILPHKQVNARTRIDCYLAKAQALAAQGLPTLEVAEAAKQVLPDVNPPDWVDDEHVLALLTSGYVRAMRAADAKQAFLQEETIMVRAGHESDRNAAVHFHNQGMFEWKIGRPLDSRTHLDKVVAIEKVRGGTQIQPLAILLQARIADEMGELRAAIRQYEQSSAGARAMHDVTTETTANAELLSTLIEAGDYARAGGLFPQVERALHAQFAPTHWWFGVLKMDAALLADHAGNEAQAQGLADDALVMFHDNSPPTYSFPVVLVKHSEFELRHGHTGEAKADAEHALAVYEQTFGKDILSCCIGDAFMAEGRALAAQGEAAAARDRFAKAAVHYLDSLGADNDKTKTAKRLAAA